MWEKNLKIYDEIVGLTSGIERKGKTMPYTSDNGYMYSLLNKDGELGMRFSKSDQKAFIAQHGGGIFKSYGAVMRDYVIIPEEMLSEKEQLAEYLQKSQAYVRSLPPNKGKK